MVSVLRTPIESFPCNDRHSRLNATRMARRLRPTEPEHVAAALAEARLTGQSIAVAGGCHAMGGQQFLTDGWLLDMRGMNRVRRFDRERGVIEAEAGINWPELIQHYLSMQAGEAKQWGIRQKQTGADRLTLGGAVSANVHGRGLTMAPFVGDIESMEVMLSDGTIVHCSRSKHADLFRHVVGGYGLFGVILAVSLRLARRRKVQRVVDLCDVDSLMERFDRRIAAGYLFGDFQFATATDTPEFLARGVFSCYRPVEDSASMGDEQLTLTAEAWRHLLFLAHRDKRRAFDEYADFYLRSSGQVYWSDTHQLSLYLDDYHGGLDHALGASVPGSEMITELYVPRERLATFMADARAELRASKANVIYGTVRLIEPDCETAMPWARGRSACVIFNLHVDHDAAGILRAAQSFVRLIDIAIAQGGSYYLTYHRYATQRQLLTCYPELPACLQKKREFDRGEVLQSDWYRYLLSTIGA